MKIKLLLFTIISNNTALHFQIFGKNPCSQPKEDDGIDVILGAIHCLHIKSKKNPNQPKKHPHSTCATSIACWAARVTHHKQAHANKHSGTSMNMFGAGQLALALCNTKHSGSHLQLCLKYVPTRITSLLAS